MSEDEDQSSPMVEEVKSNFTEEAVSTILVCGFSPDDAKQALSMFDGNVERALNYLLSGKPRPVAAAPEKRAAPSTTNLYRKLMENTRTCDAELKIEGTAVPVHKAVLASNSPFFTALFYPEPRVLQPQEEQKGAPSLDDVKLADFRTVLEFCYLGTMSGVELNRILPLYILADKFDMADMKRQLEESVIKLFNPRYILGFYLATSTNSAFKALHGRAVIYLIENAAVVLSAKDVLNELTKEQVVDVLRCAGMLDRDLVLERVLEYVFANTTDKASKKEKREAMQGVLGMIELEKLDAKGLKMAVASKMFRKEELIAAMLKLIR